MKKAYFITIHIGQNFGSVLQAIASYIVLCRLLPDYEIRLVDYIPPRVTYTRILRNCVKSPKLFLKLPFSIIQRIYNNKLYLGDLKSVCPMTKSVYNINEISDVVEDADLLITGSDQTWNSIHNEGIDRSYYWDFVTRKVDKISFASSFGRECLPEEEYTFVKKALKEFKFVSVRENTGVDIINSMGLESELFLDPSLLIDKAEWDRFINKRIIDEHYILVYLPYNIKEIEIIEEGIRQLKHLTGLKVVSFSWKFYHDKVKFADKTIHYASPMDFLTLMRDADYVITNSFHGTAFSIELNKEFWVYSPSLFSTRITSLLKLTGLEKRLATNTISKDQLTDRINYINVNRLLIKERGKVIETFAKLRTDNL